MAKRVINFSNFHIGDYIEVLVKSINEYGTIEVSSWSGVIEDLFSCEEFSEDGVQIHVNEAINKAFFASEIISILNKSPILINI